MSTPFCAACAEPLLPAHINREHVWNAPPSNGGTAYIRLLGRCPCGAITALEHEQRPVDMPSMVHMADGAVIPAGRLEDVANLARAHLRHDRGRQFDAVAATGLDVRTIALWVEHDAEWLPPRSTLAIITWAWATYGAGGDEGLLGIEECGELLGLPGTHVELLLDCGAIPSRRLITGARLMRRDDVLAWRDRQRPRVQ